MRNNIAGNKLIRPEWFFWSAIVLAFFGLMYRPDTLPQAPLIAAGSAITIPIDPFAGVSLIAKGAYVYDAKYGRPIFKKNENDLFPLASITKIMTAMTALSLVPETSYIIITGNAVDEEGDSKLNVGERWMLKDLAVLMLIESSNDGAVAISESIGSMLLEPDSPAPPRATFVREMNILSGELGLANTTFLNENGLDIDNDTAGALGTPREAALLLAEAIDRHPDILLATRSNEIDLENEDGRKKPARNTNKDTAKFPLLLASKTGYTDLAGGNLVIAFDAGFNHPIIVSVLGSTIDGRFSDAEALVWATLEYLSLRD